MIKVNPNFIIQNQQKNYTKDRLAVASNQIDSFTKANANKQMSFGSVFNYTFEQNVAHAIISKNRWPSCGSFFFNNSIPIIQSHMENVSAVFKDDKKAIELLNHLVRLRGIFKSNSQEANAAKLIDIISNITPENKDFAKPLVWQLDKNNNAYIYKDHVGSLLKSINPDNGWAVIDAMKTKIHPSSFLFIEGFSKTTQNNSPLLPSLMKLLSINPDAQNSKFFIQAIENTQSIDKETLKVFEDAINAKNIDGEPVYTLHSFSELASLYKPAMKETFYKKLPTVEYGFDLNKNLIK